MLCTFESQRSSFARTVLAGSQKTVKSRTLAVQIPIKSMVYLLYKFGLFLDFGENVGKHTIHGLYMIVRDIIDIDRKMMFGGLVCFSGLTLMCQP